VAASQVITAPAPRRAAAPTGTRDVPCRAALSAPGSPAAAPPAVAPQAVPARPRFGAWFNRPRRILLLLAAVWVVAVFDLGYTLAESGTADFVEMNPLAAKLLGGPQHFLMAYKFGLLSIGTGILLALRRHAAAEVGCWLLFGFKLYLGIRWYLYFDCLLSDGDDALSTFVK